MDKIKCIQCGKELSGDCYNTPLGIFCCSCWGKKPKKVKDKALKDALNNLASIGKTISMIENGKEYKKRD